MGYKVTYTLPDKGVVTKRLTNAQSWKLMQEDVLRFYSQNELEITTFNYKYVIEIEPFS